MNLRRRFSALLFADKFSCIESERVIEMTVDKDTKKQGGTTGFCTNDGAFRTWTLNALYAAALRKCL